MYHLCPVSLAICPVQICGKNCIHRVSCDLGNFHVQKCQTGTWNIYKSLCIGIYTWWIHIKCIFMTNFQRNESRLRVWFIIRLILGFLVVLFLIGDILSLLSVFGFDIYTIFMLSLYISWTCFIVYSLLIVRWLIQEIQHDGVIARTMYTMYSGRSPY